MWPAWLGTSSSPSFADSQLPVDSGSVADCALARDPACKFTSLIGVLPSRILEMTATSVWIPISSAAAALLGGGLGAMLQGRYGVSGWRRQTRFEAYVGFLNAIHEFNKCLLDALDAIDKPDFDEKWSKVREAERPIGRAGSLVSIAGPVSVEKVISPIADHTYTIIDIGEGLKLLPTSERKRKVDRLNETRTLWIATADSFLDAARKVLKTHGSEWYFQRQD
jgi:hypothetical protein